MEESAAKKAGKLLQDADESLKVIQLAGSIDRIDIQTTADYIKQEIHTHSQLLQNYNANQSAHRIELLQQLADAAASGDFEKMSQLKSLLDQLQSQ